MEITYLTEPDVEYPLEAWDALQDYVSTTLCGQYHQAPGVALESLSLEGYKEALRHTWEKLVEWLKKIVVWVREKTISMKARLLRTRDSVESTLGGLHALRANRTPLDHVVVPMAAHEYRHLVKTPGDKVDMRMVVQANEDMTRVMGLFFDSHVEYVRAQLGIIAEAFGVFDVLQADAQLDQLKQRLANLPFKGFGSGETNIPIVGMSEIVLDKTSHPGLDELCVVGMKMMPTTRMSGFRAPSVNQAIAVMVNLREALNRALQFQEHVLPDLNTIHQKLLHAGGMLMKQVNSLTEGSDDEAHIEAVVKQMLAIEAKIAGSVMRPLIPGMHWICETANAIAQLFSRVLHAASIQKGPELGPIVPALPSPG
jgi:hypothetical protein